MNINDMSTEQLQFITQYVPKNVVFLSMHSVGILLCTVPEVVL